MAIEETLSTALPAFMLGLGVSTLLIAAALIVLTGFALWKAARLNDKVWFWLMIVVNMIVPLVLPIVYLIMKRNKKA